LVENKISPIKSITIEFADGETHKFTPEELQALVSTAKVLDLANNILDITNFLIKNNGKGALEGSARGWLP